MSPKKQVSKRRSVCPVACTLDLIGDKWTLLVVRDLFAGRSRFTEFTQSPERIATNILADRLERLCAAGVARAEPCPEREGTSSYRLTPRGRELYGVLEAIRDWGLRNIDGTRARVAVPRP